MSIEFLLLAPLALAGLMLLNAGLTRSRSSAHLMLSSLCAISVAFLTFTVLGCAFAGLGSPGLAVHVAGGEWHILGTGRLFARSIDFNSAGGVLFLGQMVFVAMAALIPVASGAERWRLAGVCASSVLLAGLIFPVFFYWTSPDGWLGQIGFLDAAGGGSIQALGGITSLCIAWILGPRQNKFTSEGIPTAMPGHSALFVLFGSMLALVGWLGLNVSQFANFSLVAVNTLLAASSGALGALITTRIRFGKPDASLCANGWAAGLVAISASAPYCKPAGAILCGLVAGPLTVFAIELLEIRMHVDDPAGAISVHGVGGLWGLLAVSIFSDSGNRGTFLAQMLGIATLIGLVLPVTYGLNLLMNRFVPYRVQPSGERQGMDLFELGGGAYPEFVTHREDFMRR